MSESVVSRRTAFVAALTSAVAGKAQLAPATEVTGGLANGRLWVRLSEHVLKATFLIACQDALFFGSLFSGAKDYASAPEALKFPDLTRDEIIKELDLFYSEGANGPVPILHALRYVRQKGLGASQSDLQDLAANIRKNYGH